MSEIFVEVIFKEFMKSFGEFKQSEKLKLSLGTREKKNINVFVG